MPEKYRRAHNQRRQTAEDMKLAWAAERQALATVRRFNALDCFDRSSRVDRLFAGKAFARGHCPRLAARNWWPGRNFVVLLRRLATQSVVTGTLSER